MKRIGFNDLTLGIKIPIVIAWIIGIIWILYFIAGFMIGFSSVI